MMLDDFFKLNGSYAQLASVTALNEAFVQSGGSRLENKVFMPKRVFDKQGTVFRKKQFFNVSFSFTSFVRVQFTDCYFEDCLFQHTSFRDCVFIDCYFRNCNFEKVRFINCYLNPASFELDQSYKSSAANVGTWMYQQLFLNSKNTHQPRFSGDAEIQFRRWRRAQETFNLGKRLRRQPWQIGLWRWIKYLGWQAREATYDWVLGYGHRPIRFFVCSAAALALVALLVHILWPSLGLVMDGMELEKGSYLTTLYYSTVVTTTLGFGDITPLTDAGRVVAGLLSLLGLVWFSLLAAVLIKRMVK